MHKRMILTFIDKYHRIETALLSKELSLSQTQIMEIVFNLKEEEYIKVMEYGYLMITEKGKEFVFPTWNAFSKYIVEENVAEKFSWDYLYIPFNEEWMRE